MEPKLKMMTFNHIQHKLTANYAFPLNQKLRKSINLQN